MTASSAERGAEGFESHYLGQFGERWAELRRALRNKARALRRNAFAEHSESGASWSLGRVRFEPLDTAEPSFEPQRDAQGLACHYAMDPASAVPPQLLTSKLDASETRAILDLCAAPGGKALILAELFWGASPERAGSLILNERSRARRGRLHQVVQQYLPATLQPQLKITGHDAGLWGRHQPDRYDAILLDAPCSAEQHVLADARALQSWSRARIQRLAMRQYALLVSGMLALKREGRLVYATCSLADEENDGVVRRLLARKGTRVELDIDSQPALENELERLGIESTECGFRILPDTRGYGPMYFTRLKRV